MKNNFDKIDAMIIYALRINATILIEYEEVDHGEMKTYSLTKQNQDFELAKKENFLGK